MEINDPSATATNNPQEMDESKEESDSSEELLNAEQEAIYKRRLELKKTQQDLIKLVNKLHEFVNRDRIGADSSSSCGDVAVEMENSEEDGVDWEQLTNYVNQHVTELQEIRNLSTLTGVLLNRIKKIISGPAAIDQKSEESDGKSKE